MEGREGGIYRLRKLLYFLRTVCITGNIYFSFAYYCMKVAETRPNVSSMWEAKVLEIFSIHVTLRGI
jgi:hypothetical protein